jgi:hypothetical protein
MSTRILVAICLTASPALIHAAEPPAVQGAELAAGVKGLLLSNLPDPLAQTQENWGKQVDAVFGNKKKNHGLWRRVRVSAINPANTLAVDIRNLQQPNPNLMQFDLIIGVDAQVDFEQQFWDHGVRLYSGSTRARARVSLALKCEVESHAVTGKGWLPDIVFRMRVKSADLRYTGLDFVHIAGMGGDGADILGHGLHGLLKAVKPSLEKEMLAKANAAIVKAGDKKEIRIGLNKLFFK